MLTDYDIKVICEKLELPIKGVYMKDELNKVKPKPGSYYVNLDNSDGEGTHWLLVKISPRGESIYFDSYGLGMPKEVEEFLSNNKPIISSNKDIQSLRAQTCGWYCIGCDYYIENNIGGFDKKFEEFIDFWSDNPIENNKLLRKFFSPL